MKDLRRCARRVLFTSSRVMVASAAVIGGAMAVESGASASGGLQPAASISVRSVVIHQTMEAFRVPSVVCAGPQSISIVSSVIGYSGKRNGYSAGGIVIRCALAGAKAVYSSEVCSVFNAQTCSGRNEAASAGDNIVIRVSTGRASKVTLINLTKHTERTATSSGMTGLLASIGIVRATTTVPRFSNVKVSVAVNGVGISEFKTRQVDMTGLNGQVQLAIDAQKRGVRFVFVSSGAL